MVILATQFAFLCPLQQHFGNALAAMCAVNQIVAFFQGADDRDMFTFGNRADFGFGKVAKVEAVLPSVSGPRLIVWLKPD